jgi:hypothetical protein
MPCWCSRKAGQDLDIQIKSHRGGSRARSSLGLSAACHFSREIYLKNQRSVLELGPGNGIVHFNSEDLIFYVEEVDKINRLGVHEAVCDFLHVTFTSHPPPPFGHLPGMYNVQNLCLPLDTVFPYWLERFLRRPGYYFAELADSLRMFKCLKTLGVIINRGDEGHAQLLKNNSLTSLLSTITFSLHTEAREHPEWNFEPPRIFVC